MHYNGYLYIFNIDHEHDEHDHDHDEEEMPELENQGKLNFFMKLIKHSLAQTNQFFRRSQA